MTSALARRCQAFGWGLMLGTAALLCAYLQEWIADPLGSLQTLALPGLLGLLVGLSAAAMPSAWRSRLALVLAALCSVTVVLIPLALPDPAMPHLTAAVLLSALTVILLPTPPLLRAGVLLSQAALMIICAQPSWWLWPAIGIALGTAYWLGEQHLARLKNQQRERQALHESKTKLETFAAEREAVLVDQQGTMVRQAEWATLGRLTTGIAHEIKNPLHAALTDLDTVRRTHDISVLEDVEVSLRRIESTIREVSLLRPTQSTDVRAHRLQPLVEACMRSARVGLKSAHISVGDLPDVVVHSDQALLTDALVNLLANAAQAGKTRGSVRVRIHGARGQGHALLYVDDNGPGIAEAHLETVFREFHTTKAAGQGTGLGLPISRRKLQSMGASVWAEMGSALGGARLVIALPYAPRDAVTVPVRSPRTATPRQAASLPRISRRIPGKDRKHGTLLLIDDDAIVRRALKRTMARSWTVLDASGSATARQRARENPIDAVLCDMHLLQEDALDVLETLRALDPTLPTRTIFMTGEPTSLRLLALAEANPERLLLKPFNADRATRKLLAAMRGSLPPLRSDDLETPPSLGALDPSWCREAPTEEIGVKRES